MKHLVFLLSAVASFSSFAQTSSIDASVQALSHCDSAFFKTLADAKDEFAKVSPLNLRGSAPTIAVPERTHPTKSRVIFSKPVQVSGVSVVGYFDELADLSDGMTAYSWGYLIAASVDATAKAFKPHVWDAERLRSDGPVYVRSEVWSHDKPALGWARVVTESGLPKPRTVERVLLIEPYDGETAFVRFGCSIQGHVLDPMVRDLRPDLR